MDGKYGKDIDYLHANYDELYCKYKNEFVAIKNLQVYHNVNPLKLSEQLKVDGFDTDHVFIEFVK